MSTVPEIASVDTGLLRSNEDAYVELYAEIYGVEPYRGDPFFYADAYRERLLGATLMDGFLAVEARAPCGQVVGFGFGATLPPDAPWWQRAELCNPKPSDPSRRSGPDGTDVDAGLVFWLRELQVRIGWRGQGVGGSLHAGLLAARQERWVAMTVIPRNEPARSAYLRWGYSVCGQTRHSDHSPIYEVLFADAASVRGRIG